MMTLIVLAFVLIFHFVRYLLHGHGNRPLKEAMSEWKTHRLEFITTLQESAYLLKRSHRDIAETEQTIAKRNRIRDILGLSGVLLSPFLGGLSLVATPVSALIAVKSYLNRKAAKNKHNQNELQIIKDVKKAEKEDKAASEKLNTMISALDYVERKISILKKENKIKEFQSVIEAATPISKLDMAISVVSIPLDILRIIQTADSFDEFYDNVNQFEDKACQLKEELENVSNVLLVRCKYIEDFHRQLYKLYQDHQIEEVFEYLLLMYEHLGLDIPVPY